MHNTVIRFRIWGIIALLSVMAGLQGYGQNSLPPRYLVSRASGPVEINAEWDKSVWAGVKPVMIENFIRQTPAFKPVVQAKMMYDESNIYVIFRVQDRYVRTITTDINGPVWKDSAVEFFFSPDTLSPDIFFNLEINSGGTPLLGYRGGKPTVDHIKQIEIAHTLPERTDPEISEPVIWIIECRIPLTVLAHYAKVTQPRQGVTWRGNFYKIAENTSNPHYATWAEISAPNGHFHMPRFFGYLEFQ